MESEVFFHRHPVFTLSEYRAALSGKNTDARARERLQYHAKKGRIKRLKRGLYLTVSPGEDPKKAQGDIFAIASTMRDDAVLSHYAALTLLGAGHTIWNEVCVYTTSRLPTFTHGRQTLQFLLHPPQFRGKNKFGCETVFRSGKEVTFTGRERTLVEGFKNLARVGGFVEFLECVSGFPSLDLKLLLKVLKSYDERALYAAVGWFLERFKDELHVSDRYLGELENMRPKSAHYLGTSPGEGRFMKRWNLILPGQETEGFEGV